MTNIPTDLLRTLVAVVDLRSFTKAAASLGVTQPAVSSKIKRLQFLLGVELLDRSTQGVSLTSQGEWVVSYARRLLSLNDQIVNLGGVGPREELIIRVGTTSEYIASILPKTFSRLDVEWPDVRFIARSGSSEKLMRELRNGELDIFIGLSTNRPHDARFTWAEELIWVRGAAQRLEPNRPVPLISYGDSCIYRRLMVTGLKQAGYDWEDVFSGPSFASIQEALTSGLGVMAITRRRAMSYGLEIWEDTPLPKLPDLYCCIFIREGGTNAAYEQVADEIAIFLYGPDGVTAEKTDSAA